MSSHDYYNSKSNNIFTFKDGKLNLIKTFKFDIDFNINNLIYSNFGKKYLVDAHEKNNLILIELKANYDNYEIENFFNGDNNKNKFSYFNFIRSQCSYGTCMIYGKNNFDYFYIFEGN